MTAQGLLFGTVDSAQASAEAATDRKQDLVRIYRAWDDPQPAAAVTAAVRRGQIPVLSIRPRTKDGRIVPWASIARGDADAQIVKQADGLRGLAPDRLFLSFHHEPDDLGAGNFGTPADFVAAWRHYVQVFASRGITNVAFVWIMTPYSFTKSALADSYYPGDDAVDWVAEDAYNWFGCSAGKSTVWRSPTEMLSPFVAWGTAHGKPLMLAEYGSVEDPEQPQRKAQWLRDMLVAARSWPQIRAMSYFDAVGSCDWRLQTAAAQQGFADAGNDPLAHGRPSAFLQPSTVLGVAPLTEHFDASGSAGTGAATGSGVASWTLDFGDGSTTSGVGQPPANIAHSYAAGTFAARLQITDTQGAVNWDERSITAAGAPVVSGEIRDVTNTSAKIYSWVAPQGYAATVVAEWGSTQAYGQRSPVVQIPPTSANVPVTFPLDRLTPSTTYYAKVTATSAAGTRERTWTFDTPGPPEAATGGVTRVTSSDASVSGTVNPHGLATSYHFEWGASTGYGQCTASTSLSPVTWGVYVKATLGNLSGRQTYHYRLVATNSAGTAYGGDRTLTTG